MKTRVYLIRYAYVYCYIISVCLVLAAGLRHGAEMVASRQRLAASVRIVIDAGHGGIDSGTTSVTGVAEKELNLQIAKRLEKLLLLLGETPVMTRTTADSVATEGETIREQKRSDLQNRLAIVHQSPNTILVSIHQNHYPDARYAGPQVFYADDEASHGLARLLQQTMNAALKTRRECKKASGVYLMNHLQCPGILVECGFLSNYEEDAKLSTPEYQKKLSCLLASTLMKYVRTPSV